MIESLGDGLASLITDEVNDIRDSSTEFLHLVDRLRDNIQRAPNENAEQDARSGVSPSVDKYGSQCKEKARLSSIGILEK